MVSDWHPILAAVEQEPGVWVVVDSTGKRYAIVRMLRRGGELGYRAVTWAERSDDRQLTGYYRSLRGACEAAHQRFIADHTPGNHPNGLGG